MVERAVDEHPAERLVASQQAGVRHTFANGVGQAVLHGALERVPREEHRGADGASRERILHAFGQPGGRGRKW